MLNANGGDDSFSATGNLAALIQITVDGGAGDDTLLGSNGADVLLGGDGNDFIDGQQGNDMVFLGAGDDTFQWDPGDGSDTVEGQAGNDTAALQRQRDRRDFRRRRPTAARVRFTRNIGNIVMDLNDVETLDLNALGGADMLTVNDLAGTDLTSLNVDLASTLGGSHRRRAGGHRHRQRHQRRRHHHRDASRRPVAGQRPGGQRARRGTSKRRLTPSAFRAWAATTSLTPPAVGAGGPLLVLDGGVGR